MRHWVVHNVFFVLPQELKWMFHHNWGQAFLKASLESAVMEILFKSTLLRTDVIWGKKIKQTIVTGIVSSTDNVCKWLGMIGIVSFEKYEKLTENKLLKSCLLWHSLIMQLEHVMCGKVTYPLVSTTLMVGYRPCG